jgi:immunoglobulin heavy chain
MHWINQVAGKGMKYMGWINTNTGSTVYAESFKGQFVFSMDATVSTTYLQTNSV